MSGKDREFVEQVRHQVDLVEVVSEHASLRKQGANLVGLCPFHDERTPSFTVSPERQLYYCFGCGAGGDVFSFLMNAEGLEFTECLEVLARRAGLEMPGPGGDDRRVRERQELFNVLDLACKYFQAVLKKTRFGRKVAAYLEERGIEPEMADRFELGCSQPVWDGLMKALSGKGISREAMLKAGLIAPSRRGGHYDRFRGRLMFPIWDPQGRVVAFGGRLMEGEGAKYINSPETPVFTKGTVWYGLHLARPGIRRADRALVVEGYTDVIACHASGYDNAVASMGTALSREQAWVLARLTGRIIIAYDADQAGQEATLRGLDMFNETGSDVRVAVLPGGRDPDDVLREEGQEAFGELLESAVPLFDYRLNLSLSRHDVESVGGKVSAVREIAPALLSMSDEISRADAIRRLSEVLEVSEGAIRQELAKMARKTGRRTRAPGRPERRQPGLEMAASEIPAGVLKAERQIIRLLMEDSRRYRWVKGDLPAGVESLDSNEFTDVVCRTIMKAIQEVAVEYGDLRPAEVLVRLEDEQPKQLLSGLLLEDFEVSDPKRTMQDCIRTIARHRTRQKINRIQKEIRAREAENREVPPELMRELLNEQRKLHGISRGRASVGKEGRDHS